MLSFNREGLGQRLWSLGLGETTGMTSPNDLPTPEGLNLEGLRSAALRAQLKPGTAILAVSNTGGTSAPRKKITAIFSAAWRRVRAYTTKI